MQCGLVHNGFASPRRKLCKQTPVFNARPCPGRSIGRSALVCVELVTLCFLHYGFGASYSVQGSISDGRVCRWTSGTSCQSHWVIVGYFFLCRPSPLHEQRRERTSLSRAPARERLRPSFPSSPTRWSCSASSSSSPLCSTPCNVAMVSHAAFLHTVS